MQVTNVAEAGSGQIWLGANGKYGLGERKQMLRLNSVIEQIAKRPERQ